MEKEELLPVQASVNSSQRLSHSPRYTALLPHPYYPPPPTSTAMKEKLIKKKKKKKESISKRKEIKKKVYL